MSGLTTDPTLGYVLAGFSIAALIAVIAWAHAQRKLLQSLKLKQRFGREYGRTVQEAELAARERRGERVRVVPLTAAETARFEQAWEVPQTRFVNDPKRAVAHADRLVCEVMVKRGYPMGDFERRAADISVDHADVVFNYRAAHAIALRDERGEASTEELRKALVHYRTLFRDLLDPGPSISAERVPVA
jgi:hypothetical protein